MSTMVFGEPMPDKLTEMNKIIESKIKGDEMDTDTKWKWRRVRLQYLDIKLDLHFNEDGQNIITINAFSRGHYVRKNMERRIMHEPAYFGDPESEKGDGALFLALTVVHCNKVFSNILCWIGGVTDWWRIKGVCIIKDACIKTERSGPFAYEINNDIFLEWANEILILFQHQLVKAIYDGGRRTRRKSQSRKKLSKRRKTRRKRKKRKTKKRRR